MPAVRSAVPAALPAPDRGTHAGPGWGTRRGTLARNGGHAHRVGCLRRPVWRAPRHRARAGADRRARARRRTGERAGRPGRAVRTHGGRWCLGELRQRPAGDGLVRGPPAWPRDGDPADRATAGHRARRGTAAAAGRVGRAPARARRPRDDLPGRHRSGGAVCRGPTPSEGRGAHEAAVAIPAAHPLAAACGERPARGAAVRDGGLLRRVPRLGTRLGRHDGGAAAGGRRRRGSRGPDGVRPLVRYRRQPARADAGHRAHRRSCPCCSWP